MSSSSSYRAAAGEEEEAPRCRRPHAVFVPFPSQGHISPLLKLAKLLHHRGFFITMVNTHFNHNRLLRSQGPNALDGLPDFRFVSIPDGLPPSDEDATQSIPALCSTITTNLLSPFLSLMAELGGPPATCIVSDSIMSFTIDAAAELGIPNVLFWTTSACGFMAYLHYQDLVDKGIFPLKSEDDLTNGYLDTAVNWVPGMKNMRLRDFPSFVRTTDPDEVIFNFLKRDAQRSSMGAAVLVHTFEELEAEVLVAMRAMLGPPVYAVGPLDAMLRNAPENPLLSSLSSNLWKEDPGVLEWLGGRGAALVVYVNFGSIAVMTKEQLVEFAWGLADSGHDFLWVVRPDLVRGDSAALPPEFLRETETRGRLTEWCAQEAVLRHPAVGCFMTHSGWNSTIESITGGVPMLCWPFYAEQQTNTRYACTEWGVGMEVEGGVRRAEVAALVREVIGGETKGAEMRSKAKEWKESASKAAEHPRGTSFANLDRLVDDVLLRGGDN